MALYISNQISSYTHANIEIPKESDNSLKMIEGEDLNNFQYQDKDRIFEISEKPESEPEMIFNQNKNLIVLILSGRDNFKTRTMIKQTWAKNEPNVFFMVGQHYCPWPADTLWDPHGCSLKLNHTASPINFTAIDHTESDDKIYLGGGLEKARDHYSRGVINSIVRYRRLQDGVTEKLKKEEKVVTLPMVDTYNSLTKKLKLSLRWVHEMSTLSLGKNSSENTYHPKWVLKIDDDSIARVTSLEAYLQENYPINKHPNLYLGWMGEMKKVLHSGKWAEKDYKQKFYPTYANGCAGYILSWDLIKYISVNFDNLIEYHNEDASTGIWLHNSYLSKNISYVRGNKIQGVRGAGQCRATNRKQELLLLGHNMNVARLRYCWYRYFNERH